MKNRISFYVKALLIIIALELTLFNFNFYRDFTSFNFSIIRIIVIFAFVIIFHSLKNDSFWNEKYSKESKIQTRIVFAIVVITIAMTIGVNTLDNRNYSDLYNIKFVDSIEAGSLSLLEEPSEKLLNLKNPYDRIERDTTIIRDVDYIWDAALYNGKYYVYYGILPALMLYVPFHLLTGRYLPTGVGVELFSILCIVVLYFIFDLLYKKWFKNIPFKLYVFGLLSLLFGIGVIWLNVAPRFYEVVTCSGLYFTLQGLYLLWSADYSKKLPYKRLFLSTLCLSLAVACRPPFLFASILVIIWFIDFIKNNSKDKIIKTLIIMLIPYIIIGSLLMAYNYARFGSILDFGSKYQLTMVDVNHSNNFWALPQGLLCNLFNIPVLKGEFPFLELNRNMLSYNGSYYCDDMVGGLFFVAPICFSIMLLVNFLKNKDVKKDLKQFAISVFAIGLIMLLLVTLQGGSTQRYILDFSWSFIIVSIIIAFSYYENLKSKESKKIIEKVFLIILIYTMIICFLSIFMGLAGESMKELMPKAYELFEKTICFWKR